MREPEAKATWQRRQKTEQQKELQRIRQKCRDECFESHWERLGFWLLILAGNRTARADCKQFLMTGCRTVHVCAAATSICAQFYLCRQQLREEYYKDTCL